MTNLYRLRFKFLSTCFSSAFLIRAVRGLLSILPKVTLETLCTCPAPCLCLYYNIIKSGERPSVEPWPPAQVLNRNSICQVKRQTMANRDVLIIMFHQGRMTIESSWEQWRMRIQAVEAVWKVSSGFSQCSSSSAPSPSASS